MSDDLPNLPEGWAWTTIGNIFEFKYGKGLVRERRDSAGNFFVYGSGGIVGKHTDAISKGPTIIVGRKGSIGEINISTEKCWPIDTTYYIDDFPGGIPIEYWYHFFLRLQLGKHDTSTAIPGLNRNDAYNLLIPLPPLPEQHRIVARFESLLDQVNTTKDYLNRVPTIMKQFRQSVLSAACSGRLTEDWRKEHTDVEPASELLKRVRQELVNTYEEQCRKAKNEGKKNPRRPKNLDLVEQVIEEKLPEIPDGWEWTTLNKLCYSFQYGTSKKSSPNGTVPVLRMGNIQNGEIDWSDLVYSSNEDDINRFILHENTVLFNRTNSPDLVGKSGIFRGERPAIFAGYLISINNVTELDSNFLNYCLNSNHGREFRNRVKTDGVSQSNINATKLGQFMIPFPPHPEQHEIVQRVVNLFKQADMIEQRNHVATMQTERITQAILAQAFRGELAPQDPNDEPASVLLERIQQEKNNKKKRKKKK